MYIPGIVVGIIGTLVVEFTIMLIIVVLKGGNK